MIKFTHKLFQAGKHSLAVVIPKEIANFFKLRKRQKINIYKSGEKIVIEDWEKIRDDFLLRYIVIL